MRVQDVISARVAHDWTEHTYYAQAETPAFLAEFWGPDSRFVQEFSKLDLGDVAELACGRGRHTAQIVERCRSVVLLDVNASNIAACADRFKDQSHVRTIVCSGYDLANLADASLDALFSYDAMVHFEPDIVGAYVTEIARVLRPGGRALIHHSNYSANPGADYSANHHYRNFMTPDLIRHYVLRAGMTILSHQTFGWGGGDSHVDGIDALTLMEKA